MFESFACPKCGRVLRRSGEMFVDDLLVDVPMFSCDECIDEWEFDGERFEHCLTFAGDRHGRVLDPDTYEPITPERWRRD